jgi:hypothetical protein
MSHQIQPIGTTFIVGGTQSYESRILWKDGFTSIFDSEESFFDNSIFILQWNEMLVLHNKRPNIYLQIHFILLQINIWLSNFL